MKKYIYEKLLKRYGKDQLVVAMEEMSELTKELCKYLRGNGDVGHIIEEIADVEIMLEQLKMFFYIDGERLENMKDYKIKRTERRLFESEVKD